MFESKAKKKVKELIEHIEFLAQNVQDGKVSGFNGTTRELVAQFAADALDLIDHNEWGIALENFLINIDEIGFPLDRKAIDLAKDAIEACGLNYNEWKFIEALIK